MSNKEDIKEAKYEETTPVVQPEKNSHIDYVTIIVGFVALCLGALVMYVLYTFITPKTEGKTVINKSEKEVTVTDKGIADAVEKLYDAVVVVEVYSNEQKIASGTGFVYKTDDKKAYILTNNHVVEGQRATSVKVILTNGKSHEVKIEGADEYTDLAVLSLNASDVTTVAEIGNCDELRLGDTVFAIGAPLDTEYYWTVTRGILSGKDRMVEVSSSSSSNNAADNVMRVLQTDASINSGNSGGPLANSNGQVIGITNMKLVSSGVEGIGFAIPIEDAINFAEAIINGKEIKRPLLGVSMINLTDTMSLYAERLMVNTELDSGVVVAKVQSGSPAASAKLKRGDIITKIDDIEIKNVANFRYNLYKHSIGDTITLTFERDGKIETAKIKLNAANE